MNGKSSFLVINFFYKNPIYINKIYDEMSHQKFQSNKYKFPVFGIDRQVLAVFRCWLKGFQVGKMYIFV